MDAHADANEAAPSVATVRRVGMIPPMPNLVLSSFESVKSISAM
jgi:hypothetical protein